MNQTTLLSFFSIVIFVAVACGDDGRMATDTGTSDSGTPDASDTGVDLDGGAVDSGDASDASPEDGGFDLDSGALDASDPDASDPDGGDGGDASDPDASDADPGPKRVFVTEARYTGDLRGALGAASGTAAADAACQAAADAVGLGGSFVAWLSDPSASASSRIAEVGPWHRLDGPMVFASTADFAAGPSAPISITEHGIAPTVDGAGVWTGTRFDGTAGPDCGDWASDDSSLGGAGLYGATGSDWTDVGWPAFAGNMCDRLNRLYCFEQ